MNRSIFTLIAGLLTLPSLAQTTNSNAPTATKYAEVTAEQIASKPKEFYGKPVKLQATVKEVYNLNTLGLVGSETSGPEAAVNVIIPYRSTASVLEGQNVTIHGTVHQFEPEKLKRKFEWFTTSWFDRPNMVAHWPHKPMIIAESVRVPSGENLVQRAPENDPGLKPKPEKQVESPPQ